MQTLCRIRADSADLLQTQRILGADFFKKSAVSALCRLLKSLHVFKNLASRLYAHFLSGVQSLHKGSCSSGTSKSLAIQHVADAHSAYRFAVWSRSCASSTAASISMLALRMLQPTEAWLLVFFALVLTAVFIRLSVTFVEIYSSYNT